MRLYNVIKEIYQSIENELELRNSFNPKIFLSSNSPYSYSLRRALIESIQGGCDVFLSEGSLTKQSLPNGQSAIQDNRTFEGWKHESVEVK